MEYSADTKTAIKTAFLELDAAFLKKVNAKKERTDTFLRAGTTVTGLFIRSDKLFCFNLGDSMTVICQNGEAVVASTVHLPHLPKVCSPPFPSLSSFPPFLSFYDIFPSYCLSESSYLLVLDFGLYRFLPGEAAD
jgi:hypothetical protein